MDVNVTTDVKGYNVPSVSSVEQEDVQKPQIQPVPESSEGVTVELNDQALHGKNAKKEQEDGILSKQELEEAVEEIQERFKAMGNDHFKFGLFRHQETTDIVARLQDRQSGEVIKQFPSEEVLELREKLQDLIGLLFDKKV